MKYIIVLLVSVLLLFGCTLPPEPSAPGVAGQYYRAIGDWATNATTFYLDGDDTIECAPDEYVSLKYVVESEKYVYKTFYIWNEHDSKWDPRVFNEAVIGDSNWISGRATWEVSTTCASLLKDVDEKGELFAVAYSCSVQSDNSFDCHNNKWQLEIVSVTSKITEPPVLEKRCDVSGDLSCTAQDLREDRVAIYIQSVLGKSNFNFALDTYGFSSCTNISVANPEHGGLAVVFNCPANTNNAIYYDYVKDAVRIYGHINVSGPVRTRTSCVDYDGGYTVNEASKTFGENRCIYHGKTMDCIADPVESKDRCLPNGALVEAHCGSDDRNTLQLYTEGCEFGCFEGACIQAPLLPADPQLPSSPVTDGGEQVQTILVSQERGFMLPFNEPKRLSEVFVKLTGPMQISIWNQTLQRYVFNNIVFLGNMTVYNPSGDIMLQPGTPMYIKPLQETVSFSLLGYERASVFQYIVGSNFSLLGYPSGSNVASEVLAKIRSQEQLQNGVASCESISDPLNLRQYQLEDAQSVPNDRYSVGDFILSAGEVFSVRCNPVSTFMVSVP